MDQDPFAIDIPPGVVKNEAKLAASGRYIDCNNVRFVRGRAQKIGGWTPITTTPVDGIPRGMRSWGDNSEARQFIGVGTAKGLFTISNQTFEPVDITPYETIGTKTNPLTTVSGSSTVTVAFTAHGASAGQLVNFSGATAVGGLTIDGNYTIVSVPTADTFTIDAGSNASSSATGGGTVTISIELADGEDNISTGFGWGVGGWGEGTWGTPRDVSSVIIHPRSWALDNFGKILLANPIGGALYQWDPTAAPVPRASIVSGAPTKVQYAFVTSERTVFLLGTNSLDANNQDLMQFAWSGEGTIDDYDYTATASTDSGQPSGVRRVQAGSKLIAGCDLGSLLNLIWTDEAVYSNQFVRTQFVYNTKLQGTKCGLIGPQAFTAVAGRAYWMSNDAFYMFDGGVSKMPNSDDISEWFFSKLRLYYSVKTVCWHDTRYNEIWFAACVDGDSEPSLAAVYNMDRGFWFPCTMERTSATRFKGDNALPILAASDGILYQHNVGVNADTAAIDWYLESSVVQIANGRYIYQIDGVALDMQRQVGDVTITLTGYDRSNADASAIDSDARSASSTDGLVDFRISARQIKMKLEGSGVDCDFRIGIPGVSYDPIGSRT